MHCINEAEAQAWLHANQADTTQALHLFGSWHIPGDAGRKMALAKLLRSYLNWDAGVLLWVTDWGIWPSSENWLIFERLRAGSGETRSLLEAPAHLFSAQDQEEGEAVLAVGLYFMWDMTVVAAGEPVVVQFDHHETLRLLGSSTTAPADLAKAIADFFV